MIHILSIGSTSEILPQLVSSWRRLRPGNILKGTRAWNRQTAGKSVRRPAKTPGKEAALEPDEYQRISVYAPQGSESTPQDIFRQRTSNSQFRVTGLTVLALLCIMVVYPGIEMVSPTSDDLLAQLGTNQTMLMVVLIFTIILEWALFLLVFGATWTEQTGLSGIGLSRLQLLDLLRAIAFLAVAMAILAALAWILAKIGLPTSEDIRFLIPTQWAGRVVWLAVSVTAGICEEAMFRGYLMTRLRLIGKFNSWVIPTIISALVFGACHAYQGWPGFIMITVFGLLFSLLYIRTGTLWPGIIAHALWDLLALIVPW